MSAIVVTLIMVDMVGDYQEGVAWRHLIIEALILALSLAGVIYFSRLYYQLSQAKINLLRQDLTLANHELIAELAAQIQKQFDTWKLTRAEAEVGMLMLKGLSHAEIATVRNVSERTIRDQARPSASSLPKIRYIRTFRAFCIFLEDLLLPRQK